MPRKSAKGISRYEPGRFEPLSEQEIEWLDDYLLNRVDEDQWREDMDGGVINISELDGLLTAVVSGPVAIPLGQWLPAVWGDFPPVWKDDAEFERVLTLLVRHSNAIAAALLEESDSFEPLFYQRDTQNGVEVLVDDWCEGYRRGFLLTPAEWKAGGEHIIELLTPVFAFTEDAESPRRDLPDDQADMLKRVLPSCARAIHSFWLEYSREAASAPLAATPPFAVNSPSAAPELMQSREVRRVGRNDPCPCGSGKKYKKCCLQ